MFQLCSEIFEILLCFQTDLRFMRKQKLNIGDIICVANPSVSISKNVDFKLSAIIWSVKLSKI